MKPDVESLLRTLDTVLGSTLRTSLDAQGVVRATDNVVTHTGKVPDTTAANQHDRVFLKVVTLTADVGTDLTTVGEAHTCDLSKGGVRLLRGLGANLQADTTPLWTGIEVTNLGLRVRLPARLANELIDRRHAVSVASPFGLKRARKSRFSRPSLQAQSSYRVTLGARKSAQLVANLAHKDVTPLVLDMTSMTPGPLRVEIVVVPEGVQHPPELLVQDRLFP
jgi:hypothetical protein